MFNNAMTSITEASQRYIAGLSVLKPTEDSSVIYSPSEGKRVGQFCHWQMET